tara:strand:- start:84 stop:530 length:447 start_codon:yes stop_codon:yes gene_type:complete
MKIMTKSERSETISIISDVYKDVNGIRPRNYNWDAFTDKELTEFLDDLHKEADKQYWEMRTEQAKSELKFMKLINDTIASGAGNRETALRWIIQGYDNGHIDGYTVDGILIENNIDYTDFGRKVGPELEKICQNLFAEAEGDNIELTI